MKLHKAIVESAMDDLTNLDNEGVGNQPTATVALLMIVCKLLAAIYFSGEERK